MKDEVSVYILFRLSLTVILFFRRFSLCKMPLEEQSQYIFTWKIKNYLSCYQAKNEFIASPFFTIENIPDCRWCLRLYPKGSLELKDDENYVSCFLQWYTSNETTIKAVTVSYSIEIADEKHSVLTCAEVKNAQFSEQGMCRGSCKFFSVDELQKKIRNWTDDTLKLRCRIKYDKHPKQMLSGAVACTTISVDRFFVDWNVKIPFLFEYCESITFPILDVCNVEFTLNSMLDALEIMIHFKENKLEVPQLLTFTISIFNKIGCMLSSKRAVHLYENVEQWKFPEFITKEMLKNCEINSSRYEFKLKCEVCVPKKNISSNCIEKLEFESPFSWESISKDNLDSSVHNEFRNIFMRKDYSDVTIRGKKYDFPAHKFILKVRSPVFAAMFDQDMLENKTDVVDIADIDGNTLKAFLEFLYTGTVDQMDYDIAKNLMLTADKYQVPSLVDKCASFLKPIVSIKNVCEIIAIADMVGCEQLKSYALSFIEVNAAEILPTAEWTGWIEGNVKLATYILSKLSANFGKSPLNLF